MRTEKEVLKDFEELGYKVIEKEWFLELINNDSNATIDVDFEDKEYWKENSHCYSMRFTMQEHKLLNELFTIWGWL